jgi:hypothetical protein
MNYLIYHNGESFYTNWFSVDNHYMAGMIVFDLWLDKFTDNGVYWIQIKQDHL